MSALLFTVCGLCAAYPLAVLGDHVMASLADQVEVAPHSPPAVTGIRG